MIVDSLLIAAGLVLLFAGGESLVRGAVALAHRLALSSLVIGLVVVGFGTSMPELLVSVQAALSGSPDIAVGNVVGSNISNILLILGIAAVLFPIAIPSNGIARDLFIMTAVAAIMLVIGWQGDISRPIGALMLATLVAYLFTIYTIDRNRDIGDDEQTDIPMAPWKMAGFLIFGLGALFLGADLLVDGATRIARDFGVAEAVIGLTVVAIGTSLPELATAVVAAFRKHSDVALGNVVGSNIFNILGILGITAMVAPVSVADQIATFDIPVMLGISVALAALMLLLGRIGRVTGAAMLAGYVIYVVVLF